MAAHWTAQLTEKFKSAVSRAFIIHGNTDDFVKDELDTSLRRFLIESFQTTFDVVVVYSRSSGFYFPGTTERPRMKQVFLEMCGLSSGSISNPAATARSGSGAGALGAALSSGQDPEKALATLAKQPVAALDLIARALAFKGPAQRVVVILEYGETLAPNGDLAGMSEADRTVYATLSDIGRDNLVQAPENLQERQHAVIMLTKNIAAISDQIKRSGWEQIEILLPDFEERQKFIETLLENFVDGEGRHLALDTGVTAKQVAQLTTGLAFRGILDVFKRALHLKQPVTLRLVKDRKDELVAQEFNEVLTILDETTGFEKIGGMEPLKLFFRENVIRPMRDNDPSSVPQGVLMMGPPGTGKTRIAKAVAKEAGVTFVELQLSKIYGRYVGDSERNLARALNAIKSMIPCLVFVDEIDQAAGRGEGGDSGVSSRVFKSLLEVMSDTTLRGKVLFIAATNRVDLMDAAFKRAGRFDVKVPVMAPDADERADILKVQVANFFPSPIQLGTTSIYKTLADDMLDYTGAEIELVVSKAFRLWTKNGRTGPLAPILAEAHSLILPTTQDLGRMSRLALENCSDLELVPERYREEVRRLRKGGVPETAAPEPAAAGGNGRLKL